MQKNRFATYLSMVLSLVGLVLLLALPFVNMQGVRSFSFLGLLSGSGFPRSTIAATSSRLAYPPGRVPSVIPAATARANSSFADAAFGICPGVDRQ